MKKLIFNKYLFIYLLIYLASMVIMVFVEDYPAAELVSIFILLGPILTSIAYFVSRTSTPMISDKKAQQNEVYLIITLVIYFMIAITFHREFLSLLSGGRFPRNSLQENLVILLFKLSAFVIIPIVSYFLAYRFTLKEWGIIAPLRAIFSLKSISIFLIMAFLLFLVQFFMGNGARPIREGILANKQLWIGLPLFYLWLILEVGIVEEFFFRTLLQSRISVLLNSETSGIVISALIFGLAHAPGIYLREGGVLANLGNEPSLWLSIGYSICVLSIAGFFLAVIWAKTKNFWLIVGIHAFVDLLPGLKDFVEIWGIR